MSYPGSKTQAAEERAQLQQIANSEYIFEEIMNRRRFSANDLDLLADALMKVAKGVPLRKAERKVHVQ